MGTAPRPFGRGNRNKCYRTEREFYDLHKKGKRTNWKLQEKLARDANRIDEDDEEDL